MSQTPSTTQLAHTLRAPPPPRQVRNLRSCIKVAVDFVSPDSLAQLAQLATQKRLIALQESGAPEDKCAPPRPLSLPQF